MLRKKIALLNTQEYKIWWHVARGHVSMSFGWGEIAIVSWVKIKRSPSRWTRQKHFLELALFWKIKSSPIQMQKKTTYSEIRPWKLVSENKYASPVDLTAKENPSNE